MSNRPLTQSEQDALNRQILDQQRQFSLYSAQIKNYQQASQQQLVQQIYGAQHQLGQMGQQQMGSFPSSLNPMPTPVSSAMTISGDYVIGCEDVELIGDGNHAEGIRRIETILQSSRKPKTSDSIADIIWENRDQQKDPACE